MKKKIKFFGILTLAALAALGMISCKSGDDDDPVNPVVPVEPPYIPPGGRVDTVPTAITGGTEIFVYVPGGINAHSKLTEPCITIYGSTRFTEASVKQIAEESGLAALAKRENCVLAFVNPVSGTTWGRADVDAYRVYARLFAERQDQTVPPNQAWDEELQRYANGQYSGYAFNRLYVIAEGSGADFVSQYLVDDAITALNRGGHPNPIRDRAAPVSFMLFNPTTVPTKGGSANNRYPAIIVNGSLSVNLAYGLLNPSRLDRLVTLTSSVTSGFDYNIIRTQFDKLLSVRKASIGTGNDGFIDVSVFGAMPMEITERTTYSDTVPSNVKSVYYVPDSVKNAAAGTVPAVFLYHGGGELAEYIALLTDWPRLAVEEKFIVVAVENHSSLDNLFAQHLTIIDDAKTDFPQIDSTRIYATGFSMGSIKSLRLGILYPNVHAAIAPMDIMVPLNQIGTLTSPKMPVFYVAGQEDGYGGVFPRNTAGGAPSDAATYTSAVDTLTRLWTMNEIGTYSYSFTAHPWWGVTPTSIQTFNVTYGAPMTISINSYASSDGNIYTKLVDVTRLGHYPLLDIIPYAWEFMKQFRRNADGSISIIQ